jgi:hypothetical protein
MKAVYLAADPIEAELVRDYLAAAGIEAYASGINAWGGRGELPLDAYPRLHLRDPGDEVRARALLREYERRAHIPWHWRCPCGECSPEYFEICWHCGADKP